MGRSVREGIGGCARGDASSLSLSCLLTTIEPPHACHPPPFAHAHQDLQAALKRKRKEGESHVCVRSR